MKENIEVSVARLDGLLTGIVSLNGKINDYYAGAFILQSKCRDDLRIELEHYFQSRRKVNISEHRSEISLKDLEQEIQKYIAENIFDAKNVFNSETLNDRKKYLSFKIMDMIDFIFINFKHIPYAERKIIKLHAVMENFTSDLTFFCIPLMENSNLVLQFSIK